MIKTKRWMWPTVLLTFALLASGCTQTCQRMRADRSGHSAYVVLRCMKQFSTFTEALDKAGLATSFKVAGAYTMFVPTNLAFKKLPKCELKKLERPINLPRLRNLLWNHILTFHLTPAAAKNQPTRLMANQNRAMITSDGDYILMINQAEIISGPFHTRNATIYGINQVLIPPGSE